MKIRNIPFHILSKLGFYEELRMGGTRRANAMKPAYYIIRRALRWGDAGFFSNYFFALSHYAHALERGLRPVVDMRNYSTLYSEAGGVDGERNAWNFFFRQPYSTREAYRSGRFVLSNALDPIREFNPVAETDSTCELNSSVAPMLLRIAGTDLAIRQELVKQFSREFDAMFSGKRVMGIHYRGGDKRAPPPGHRFAVSEAALLDALNAMLIEKPDAIFLASDENGIEELLQASTTIPVICLSAKRLPAGSHEGLHTFTAGNDRPMHRYLLGLEVLRDAWFLSRCDSLLCGHSNVSNAALFLRGRPFRTLRIVDTGAPLKNDK